MPEPRHQPVTQNAWVAGIRITRPWNLVMIALAMAIFTWRIGGANLRPISWAVAAMVALAAAAQVITD